MWLINNYENMLILFNMSMLLFSLNYKNIISILISLEFIFINTIYMMYMTFKFINMNLYFTIFVLTLMVCESILGLTILMFMARKMGNDYMNLLNLMKW